MSSNPTSLNRLAQASYFYKKEFQQEGIDRKDQFVIKQVLHSLTKDIEAFFHALFLRITFRPPGDPSKLTSRTINTLSPSTFEKFTADELTEFTPNQWRKLDPKFALQLVEKTIPPAAIPHLDIQIIIALYQKKKGEMPIDQLRITQCAALFVWACSQKEEDDICSLKTSLIGRVKQLKNDDYFSVYRILIEGPLFHKLSALLHPDNQSDPNTKALAKTLFKLNERGIDTKENLDKFHPNFLIDQKTLFAAVSLLHRSGLLNQNNFDLAKSRIDSIRNYQAPEMIRKVLEAFNRRQLTVTLENFESFFLNSYRTNAIKEALEVLDQHPDLQIPKETLEKGLFDRCEPSQWIRGLIVLRERGLYSLNNIDKLEEINGWDALVALDECGLADQGNIDKLHLYYREENPRHNLPSTIRCLKKYDLNTQRNFERVLDIHKIDSVCIENSLCSLACLKLCTQENFDKFIDHFAKNANQAFIFLFLILNGSPSKNQENFDYVIERLSTDFAEGLFRLMDANFPVSTLENMFKIMGNSPCKNEIACCCRLLLTGLNSKEENLKLWKEICQNPVQIFMNLSGQWKRLPNESEALGITEKLKRPASMEIEQWNRVLQTCRNHFHPDTCRRLLERTQQLNV